jgi:hypothetical protein
MIKIPVNDNYSEIEEAHPCKGDEYPCIICGKPVKSPKYLVWVHMGGSHAVTEEEGIQLNQQGHEGADLGYYPIGANCLNKHTSLKPYVSKVK